MDELAGTEWRRDGDTIVRDLQFDDFQMARRIDALGAG
jgi:hypothetical protein